MEAQQPVLTIHGVARTSNTPFNNQLVRRGNTAGYAWKAGCVHRVTIATHSLVSRPHSAPSSSCFNKTLLCSSGHACRMHPARPWRRGIGIRSRSSQVLRHLDRFSGCRPR